MIMKWLLLMGIFTLSCALGVRSVSAAIYHVDFVGGDNTADGLTPQTAWKHSPGDPNATDNPKSAALKPGDTILFKGGVTYHGSVKLTASGAPGQPIVLDGNSAGTFGTGRAVLDGGRVIEGWRRCRSAEEAGGNPRWQDIFVAEIDLDISSNFSHGEVVVHRQVPRNKQAPWQRIILSDGDRRLLPISQLPKPKDPFYPDLPSGFYSSPDPLVVRAQDKVTVLKDEKNLAGRPAGFFDGMMVAVHGGNNHVYFAMISKYDAAAKQLEFAEFKPSTYPTTKFALFNSVRLIELPGEWAIAPAGPGHTRIYLLPDRLEGGQPANIGFPVFATGISIESGASHIQVRGLLVQRFSGGAGGVSVARNNPRSRGITVADCEVRFVAGHAGIGLNHADDLTVENCYVHQCPGWTTGIFISRVNDYIVRNCRLDKNSGSGIRHYECTRGKIQDNVILNHYGMHSSTINVYEGCADVTLEGNYLQNTVTINRNAENIVFRNNVIDSQQRAAVNMALWNSGRTGGTAIRNIQFINNTFINTSPTQGWAASVFIQTSRSPSMPTGLVIRNNILDRLTVPNPATIENNIFLRETAAAVRGTDGAVVADPKTLFRDPDKGDYRRRPGGPKMDVGANVPPPPAQWK